VYISARTRIITGEIREYCQQNSGSAADTKTLMVARPFYSFCWDLKKIAVNQVWQSLRFQ